MIAYIEYLGMPTKVALALVGMFLVMQIIGELLELTGKVVPEFVKIRKFFSRRRNEKKQQIDTLQQVQVLLNEVNQHYNQDNITKRNAWMSWVNSRAEVYDASVAELVKLKEALAANNELTLDMYVNLNRNRIIDFARLVADDSVLTSREEFNRIYKINKEYHATLKKYGKENGEVDIAMKVIDEAYDYRLKNHAFIEDVRGYGK